MPKHVGILIFVINCILLSANVGGGIDCPITEFRLLIQCINTGNLIPKPTFWARIPLFYNSLRVAPRCRNM